MKKVNKQHNAKKQYKGSVLLGERGRGTMLGGMGKRIRSENEKNKKGDKRKPPSISQKTAFTVLFIFAMIFVSAGF